MHESIVPCTLLAYHDPMIFRANEEEAKGRDRAVNYLLGRSIAQTERANSLNALDELIDKYGPVIESYPSWHPLVSANFNCQNPATTPSQYCGYEGLDHSVFLANGFITCPYGNGNAVIESVRNLPASPDAFIETHVIEAQLYHPSTTPIFVSCEWQKSLTLDRMIRKGIAVPLLLEHELKCWRSASLGESWETMRPYFLGRPHGARSSLFVDQETGQAIKKLWIDLINTGAFGPIRVD